MTRQHTDRPAWVNDAVFYQIFVDRFARSEQAQRGLTPWGERPTRENFFGGDLTGIREKLPYLADLGITALYLTPIFQAGTNHRYDAHDYRKIDPMLGDTHSLKALVRDAHALGIRVLLDGVFNHCGDGFWAFRDLMQNGEASPYRDWFFPRKFPIEQNPPTYQTCGGAAYLPKLNTGNPETRRYLIDTATYWIEEADIDGWRLDVPWKAARDFWDELRGAVKAVKPEAYLVGEIWRDAIPWLGAFDGVMNYRLRDVQLDFCIRDHMDAEDATFETTGLVAAFGDAIGAQLNLLGSHDTTRLRTLAGGDVRRTNLALTAMFTSPGAPMLYYGDEIGMEGENDPDCRRCMIWDESLWQPEIAQTVRKLIAIRRAHPALRHGTWEPLLAFNGVLAYRRAHESGDIVVLINPRDAQTDLVVPVPAASAAVWHDLLTGTAYPIGEGALRIERLAAGSALILAPDGRG
jgi:glycosidase